MKSNLKGLSITARGLGLVLLNIFATTVMVSSMDQIPAPDDRQQLLRSLQSYLDQRGGAAANRTPSQRPPGTSVPNSTQPGDTQTDAAQPARITNPSRLATTPSLPATTQPSGSQTAAAAQPVSQSTIPHPPTQPASTDVADSQPTNTEAARTGTENRLILNRNLQNCLNALQTAAAYNCDNFADEMGSLFRPHQQRLRSSGPQRRGPRICTWQMKFCCLRLPVTVNQRLPRGKSLKALDEVGLGCRTTDRVRLNLTPEELREIILQLFPLLRDVPSFVLLTTSRGGVLTRVPQEVEYAPQALRNHLGRRFAGQLVISPSAQIHPAPNAPHEGDTGEAAIGSDAEPNAAPQVQATPPAEVPDIETGSQNEDTIQPAPSAPHHGSNDEPAIENAGDAEVSINGRGNHPTTPDTVSEELDDTLPDMMAHSNPTRLLDRQRHLAVENLSNATEINIRRGNLFQDVLSAYRNRDIVRSRLRVVFVGEHGEDFDGLSREMFTLFWEHAVNLHFTGHSQFYPQGSFASDGLEDVQWMALGRVLYHGYLLLRWLPPSFSRVSLHTALTGDVYPSTQPVFQSFLETLSPGDRDVFDQAMQAHHRSTPYFPEQLATRLVSILSNMHCSSMPTPHNFQDFVDRLARFMLIERPFYILYNMHQGVADGVMQVWRSFTISNTRALLQAMEVSVDSMIRNIQPEYSENPVYRALEETVFSFLEDYIRNCDPTMLSVILQFATGTTVILGSVTVCFDGNQEANSFIHASTCGTQLFLSRFIPSFELFKRLLDAILRNRDLWSRFDSI